MFHFEKPTCPPSHWFGTGTLQERRHRTERFNTWVQPSKIGEDTFFLTVIISPTKQLFFVPQFPSRDPGSGSIRWSRQGKTLAPEGHKKILQTNNPSTCPAKQPNTSQFYFLPPHLLIFLLRPSLCAFAGMAEVSDGSAMATSGTFSRGSPLASHTTWSGVCEAKKRPAVLL